MGLTQNIKLPPFTLWLLLWLSADIVLRMFAVDVNSFYHAKLSSVSMQSKCTFIFGWQTQKSPAAEEKGI